MKKFLLLAMAFWAAVASAQPFNPTAFSENIRSNCIAGRRLICGRILKVLPQGLVIESGYPSLQRPELRRSWLIPSTVAATRDTTLVEGRQPDALCVGTVLLSDFPKSRRAKPKPYDYVVIEAFPAGESIYTSVGEVRHSIRHFSAVLEEAVKNNRRATLAAPDAGPYEVFVSNERSGDLTVIDGATFNVLATIPVGKRPRGVHLSADGKTVFVALSGTPISAPPKLDANGNPIFVKGGDDDDEGIADKAADGIGVVDVAQRKLLRKIPAGSDPEQFAVGSDGKLYIANEDVGTATILDPVTGKIVTFIPVSREPEGVGLSPDGSFFYVTCEPGGQVYGIDRHSYKVIARIDVHPRPRSVDFLPDGSRAFISSESAGEMNVIDCVHQTLIKTITLPKGSRPMCVKVAPDGQRVYASGGRSGTVCVLDANSEEFVKTIKAGKRPWGIAISPDGRYLYAANGPSDDVSVIDLSADAEVARVKAGSSPWGVVVVRAPPVTTAMGSR